MKSLLVLLFIHSISCSFGDAEIDKVVRDHMKTAKLVGLGIGLVHDGKVVYLKGYGYENKKKKIKVDPRRTMFRWASISKTLTGTAAVRMFELGLIDFHEDIRTYYKNYKMPKKYYQGKGKQNLVAIPSTDNVMTLHHLLTHTAGIQHYGNGKSHPSPPRSWSKSPKTNKGVESALKFWAKNPLISLPGEEHHYTTVGYNLAGVVMLKASPYKKFGKLISELVAKPAGLKTLRVDYQWRKIPRRAVGYVDAPVFGIIKGTNSDISWKQPGGGFISSVNDLAKYGAYHLENKFFENPETIKVLMTPKKLGNGKKIKYGYGFASGGKMRAGHSGSQEKAKTKLSINFKNKLVLALMSNTNHKKTALSALSKKIEKIMKTRLAEKKSVIILEKPIR